MEVYAYNPSMRKARAALSYRIRPDWAFYSAYNVN